MSRDTGLPIVHNPPLSPQARASGEGLNKVGHFVVTSPLWILGTIMVLVAGATAQEDQGSGTFENFGPANLGGVVVGLTLFIVGFWLAARRFYRSPGWKRVIEANRIDFHVAKMLRSQESDLATLAATPVPRSSSIRLLNPMLIGEVQRHFDTETSARIDGWMNHQFWVEGWAVGVQIGRLGIGLGKIGLPGVSEVSLSLEGTSRANLMADGFVAVVESPDINSLEVVRIVCPSQPACDQVLQTFIRSIGASFGDGSHVMEATNDLSTRVRARTDVSFISDRMNAILRMTPPDRPLVTVAGAPLTEHAMLGCAIRFEGDERWYALAPVALMDRIANTVSRAIAEAEVLSTRMAT